MQNDRFKSIAQVGSTVPLFPKKILDEWNSLCRRRRRRRGRRVGTNRAWKMSEKCIRKIHTHSIFNNNNLNSKIMHRRSWVAHTVQSIVWEIRRPYVFQNAIFQWLETEMEIDHLTDPFYTNCIPGNNNNNDKRSVLRCAQKYCLQLNLYDSLNWLWSLFFAFKNFVFFFLLGFVSNGPHSRNSVLNWKEN